MILLLAFVCGYLIPWWAACALAFIAALILGKTSTQAFWSGFGGMAIAWGALALMKSIPNDHLLATRVAQVFHVKYWWAMLAVTVLIGGIVGGFSALSGLLVKKVFEKAEVQK
ncbi:hypothetical protein D0C36_16985 [Mucilaginibacter conchicola]|uniref:Uncharacterized protein n=2 Tax=Mucilaginibacter conchicola TaxID=2303333 RepID=A0A372NP64_9SPHI|nr:hypothetical protein D0C36_16985 [Mucilaginibacter conchicola]